MVNPGALAIGGILGLIGIGSIRSGLRAGRIGDRIESAQRVNLGDVHASDGPVIVKGTVEHVADTDMIQPPDTDEECVIHRVAVEYEGEVTVDDNDGAGAHKRSTWRWNYDHVEHVPFRLSNAYDDIRVELPEEWDGSRKEGHKLVDAAFEGKDRTVYEIGEDFPDWLRSHIAESSDLYDEETGGGLSHNALNPDVRRRVSRRLIQPGDEVTVVGDVVNESGVTKITGDPKVGSMLVSVRDPEEISEAGSGTVRYLIGAFLLGWAALMIYFGI